MKKIVLLAVVAGVLSIAKCHGAYNGQLWLVQSETLKQADLEIAWQNKVPVNKGESLQNLLLVGSRVYTVSSRNYMVSLNRQTGAVIFSATLAGPGLSLLGLSQYENTLYSITGNSLIEIDSQSGLTKALTPLGFGASCPAARNSKCFYIAASDRRLHVLRAEDKVPLFSVAAENDSLITTLINAVFIFMSIYVPFLSHLPLNRLF